ncbi:MAG: alpha/beta fold hydrolase [Candidatus Hydrogenedens sp.]|nr:alpha/beta fold hydrolase [Candidatus Hydrogenedens sp.]
MRYLAGIGLILVLLAAPIAAKALFPETPRSFNRIPLESTQYEEIRFANTEQDLELAGMLFWPEGEGPFPLVVVIHGAGNSFRGNPWYLSFVTQLQAQGIAVLLPDKRGCEQSEGDWHTASFTDLATDTYAAIDHVRAAYAGKVSCIGVLGASQGGQIAPIVGAHRDDIGFVVNVVGSAVPFDEAFHYEENLNLRAMGVLPGLSNVIAYASCAWIRHVAQKDFWSAVGHFDPLPYWQESKVPALVIYGAEDTNVPSQASADRLKELGRDDLEVEIYPGSTHKIEDPPGQGDSYFRADAIERMTTFIRAHCGATDAPAA